MDDLVTWLRAQLDEDERAAKWSLEHAPGAWATDQNSANFDPARALAEVEAKRRILDNWREADRDAQLTGGDPRADALAQGRRLAYESVLRWLGVPYADRPGYREEWRP